MALTRAQRFCFIMCPLDMKGIIGAATVVGCLQHGVGICDERSTGSCLLVKLKAGSLAQSRDDSNVLEAFRLSATVKTGEFPPAALVEVYHEPEASAARLRRMVIVDLCHPRKTATRTEKHFYQQITGLRNERGGSVTPIPLCNQEEWRYRKRSLAPRCGQESVPPPLSNRKHLQSRLGAFLRRLWTRMLSGSSDFLSPSLWHQCK